MRGLHGTLAWIAGSPLAVASALGHESFKTTAENIDAQPFASSHVPRAAVKLLDYGGRLGNGWAKPKKRTEIVRTVVEAPGVEPSTRRLGIFRHHTAAGIAHELRTSKDRSFTDLFRATADSPAFGVRTVEATAASGKRLRPPAPRDRGPRATPARRRRQPIRCSRP